MDMHIIFVSARDNAITHKNVPWDRCNANYEYKNKGGVDMSEGS
jgi:hypothetical protein